jgi:hypothetical protein
MCLSVKIVNNSSHVEEEALAYCAVPSRWCFGASLKYFVIPKILLLLAECLPVATV